MLRPPGPSVRLVAGLLLLGASATANGESAARANPFDGKPRAIHEGRQLYLKTGCYNCHGFEATGGGIAPDLSAFKGTPDEMFKVIQDGRPGTLMPSWKNQLSTDDTWKIVTYLQSLKPPS